MLFDNYLVLAFFGKRGKQFKKKKDRKEIKENLLKLKICKRFSCFFVSAKIKFNFVIVEKEH